MPPSIAVPNPNPSCPSDNDIVVVPDPAEPGRFALSRVKGAAEVSWSTKAAAIESARRFADACGIDVWMNEGSTVTLLYSASKGVAAPFGLARRGLAARRR